MRTAAIISYCSYHNAYIDRCIAEALKAADTVIVVSHSHFYDGKYDSELKTLTGVKHFRAVWSAGMPARYNHNQLRKFGYGCLISTAEDSNVEYDAVFFIDADEILEGDKVKQWLQTIEPDQDYKLAHFWYYRDTCYRADQIEEGTVLVSTATLQDERTNWYGEREREDYSTHYNYKASFQNKVLGHHYSWAGTQEMLLRKVQSWGHNQDMDWTRMVEEEFTHEFNGCPFRPDYTFTKIEPFIGFTFDEKIHE